MSLIPLEQIQRRIYNIRDRKVMVDNDLAELYGVETFNLNKAVQRNKERFPDDFMFQLTEEEYRVLRFQIGISKRGRGGRRYRPFVFTRDGVSMLSSVLRSPRAIQVNITIMRAFGRFQELVATHKEFARKLEELEKKFDAKFRVVFDAIRRLMAKPAPKHMRIRGFRND